MVDRARPPHRRARGGCVLAATDRLAAMAERDLTPLFRPRSLAVIGASDDPTKIRGRILAQIRQGGYPGRIFPIHPSHAAIQGLPAFAAIGAVPERVDLALIAIP